MATMNISLPDSMREAMTARIEQGLYANTSDYVRDLVRRDLETVQSSTLLDLLEEGENSPLEEEDFDRHAFFAELMAEGQDAAD